MGKMFETNTEGRSIPAANQCRLCSSTARTGFISSVPMEGRTYTFGATIKS
jgi:hypothetical protein